MRIAGLHHVTAVAGDPQPILSFYARRVGLRLIKQTVNFDAPDVYHFYFGNAEAAPGSVLTFFPFLDVAPGRAGHGAVTVVRYGVPEGALARWMDRLADAAVDFDGPTERFGEQTISLVDPDGLRIELVGMAGLAAAPEAMHVPAEDAARRLHSVAIDLAEAGPTAALMTELFGYEVAGEEGGYVRLVAADGGFVELRAAPQEPRRRPGAGTVHHVAFRARDDAELAAWRAAVGARGLAVTPIKDRKYFRSIYFREPGGVLFEIATDAPGFAVDESPETLGTRLMLPEWLEEERPHIERRLPPIDLPPHA